MCSNLHLRLCGSDGAVLKLLTLAVDVDLREARTAHHADAAYGRARAGLALSALLDQDLDVRLRRVDATELAHKRRAPERGRVLLDVLKTTRQPPPGGLHTGHTHLEEFAVVHSLRLLVHRHRLVYRVSHRLGVPRVDDDRAVQALGRASELREDHHTVLLLLARDVLVADEVHAVARAADEADIADRVERAQLVERQGLVHEVDGHEVDSAEATIDTADKLVDGRAEVLVLLDVLTRRDGQLDEDDLQQVALDA